MAAPPVLKRFDVFVYKDKTPTDKAQIPAASTINFYRQGATVKTAVSVPPQDPSNENPPTTDVHVYHMGGIIGGETLWVDGNSAKDLVISAIDVPNLVLKVLNGSPSTINLAVGNRLVLASSPISIYSDPVGAVAIGTSITTNATTGRANGYIREYRFDYVVNITGVTPRVYSDAEGSFVMRT